MPARLRLDVLANPPARRLLRSAAFPLALQAIALLGVIALAWNGWAIGTDAPAADLKLLRKTNLTTLFVWGLWWPAMIASALLVGRAWCTVCPMELVNRISGGIARRLGLPRARLGGWLRAGWLVVAAYLALQLLVAGASIHRVPHYTALLLLALLGAALLSGLVFSEPRAFCKAVCPAGALLSVYGRFTPVQLDVKDPAACDACATKDCVSAAHRDRLDRRSCPSSIRPFAREPGDACVLCLQCAKVCPHENVGLGLAGPASPLRAARPLRPAEVGFVMVASGFVTHELAGEVEWLEVLFHRIPEALCRRVPGLAFGWAEAAWFLVAFPALFWLAAAVLARLAGQRGSLGGAVVAAASGAAPVIAAAHLAKALAKSTSWAGFLPGALADPSGLATLRAIAGKVQPAPAALAPLSLVGALVLVLVVALATWSWRRVAGDRARAGRVGAAAAAALMCGVLAAWLRG
jgi:polyferredoxin